MQKLGKGWEIWNSFGCVYLNCKNENIQNMNAFLNFYYSWYIQFTTANDDINAYCLY